MDPLSIVGFILLVIVVFIVARFVLHLAGTGHRLHHDRGHCPRDTLAALSLRLLGNGLAHLRGAVPTYRI